MNILFLSQLLPFPLDAGAKVRSYYTLRWLADKHQVTLATFTRPDDPPEAMEHLRSICQAVHTVPVERSMWRDALSLVGSMIRGQSFIINRDRSTTMGHLLERLLAQQHFDAVHADQLWMAQFALRFALRASTDERYNDSTGNIPSFDNYFVLDEHNACFQIFERLAKGERHPLKRWLWQREADLLRRYEAAVCNQFDHVVTVTIGDRCTLESLSHSERGAFPNFHTIPICVDTANVPAVTPQGSNANVLYLGTMFWPPNVEGAVWFLQEVWPLVRHELPQATFTIAGKNPPAELAALAVGQNVELTGYVPDPLPWLEQARAFIIPLLSGGGMRVKIVEAWRWGLPIVSTTLGAEGIDYRDGENLLIGNTPADFAAAVLRLLREPDLNQRLRVNGRRWVEKHYDYRRVYGAWDEVYQE